MAFVWKNTVLDTYGDIIDYALKLKDKKELAAFVKSYGARGPYALSNLGYFSGYYNPKTAAKIRKIFNTEHPIFGKTTPTTDEAFTKGRKLGERHAKRK